MSFRMVGKYGPRIYKYILTCSQLFLYHPILILSSCLFYESIIILVISDQMLPLTAAELHQLRPIEMHIIIWQSATIALWLRL